MDFTLKKYTQLLLCFERAGYQFITFEDYCDGKVNSDRFVILRHDVDLKAENSLATAKIEASLGIYASYYFRVVPQSNRPEIIRGIASLGHEIGYHYEDMAICQGDTEKAIVHFKEKLEFFRKFYSVKTVCMHGSPRSPFDGRDLWKTYDYRDFGIIGEPYFDTDFSKLFYLTDTGRRWDGFNVSVRDKIPVYQDLWTERGLVYHSTDDVIRAIEEGTLPHKLMITTHPQRWTDNLLSWGKEYISQKIKNIVKKMLIAKITLVGRK
ncbi:MAG: hypothetical protein IKP89_04910 [Bacteroidales bacterium]|nr:hypothetical protein [Bacteroidales bacterium]